MDFRKCRSDQIRSDQIRCGERNSGRDSLPAGGTTSLSSSPPRPTFPSPSPIGLPREGVAWPSPSHPLRTTHLGPGSHAPLGWTGHAEAGPPGLRPVPRAGLGRHGLVGTVGEGQQALHPPGLHPQLPAAPAAGTPLFYHPPGDRQGKRRRGGGSMRTLPPRVAPAP